MANSRHDRDIADPLREAAASFARRLREQPGHQSDLEQARRAFRSDWETLTVLAVDEDVNRLVDELLTRHPLRGADAIHLASAISVRELIGADVMFACADRVLSRAAQDEGLAVVP